MKIVIEKLLGDASVNIYNKQGELIHTEGFSGKGVSANFVRSIPVPSVEYGYSKALVSGSNVFKYRVTE